MPRSDITYQFPGPHCEDHGMNVFARAIITTLCVSAAAFTSVLERQQGRSTPPPPRAPAPTPAPTPAATPAPDGDARAEFQTLSLSSGELSPYMERFTFSPSAAGSGDPDREVGVPGSPAAPLPIELPR